jgi:hypothetical protein
MIYLVIGKRGQGKTTLAVYLARKNERRFIFDPRGMIAPARDGFAVSGVSTVIMQGVDQVIERDEGMKEVVVRPSLDVQAAFNALVNELYQWLKAEPNARFVLLIDEVRFIKDLQTPQFEWLLRCSQPDRVHVLLTCHRPTDIPTDIRAIADNWLVFRMTQEHDLKTVAERSQGAARLARHLGPREFVHWDDAAGEHNLYRRADRWFVPLARSVPALEPEGATLGLEPEPPDRPKLF